MLKKNIFNMEMLIFNIKYKKLPEGSFPTLKTN